MRYPDFAAARRVLNLVGVHDLDHATTCPVCEEVSLETDAVEVDVGVGVMRGNQTWECPTHGEFSFTEGGQLIFRDELNHA